MNIYKDIAEIQGYAKKMFQDDGTIDLTTNPKKGGFTLKINGVAKPIHCKTYKEVAKEIRSKCVNLAYKGWYQDFQRPITEANAGKDSNEIGFAVENEIETLAEFWIRGKEEACLEHTTNGVVTAFGGLYNVCNFDPSNQVNEFDLKVLDGVVYCTENAQWYFKLNNNYTLIGSTLEIKSSESVRNKLAKFITDMRSAEQGLYDNEGHPMWDIWKEQYKLCDSLTTDFNKLKEDIGSQISAGATSPNFPVYPSWLNGKPINVGEFMKLNPSLDFPDNWIDKLYSAIAKQAINHVLSSFMLNKKMSSFCRQADENNGRFLRFALKSAGNSGKISLPKYLSEIFSCQGHTLEGRLPTIDVQPKVISDILGVPCTYFIQDNWKERLPEQSSIKDCIILKTFLSPYSQEERNAIMAWAYTVLHPSTGETINFLLQTGGGTFKSNYYWRCICELLSYMYSKDPGLNFETTGEQWAKDTFCMESPETGRGISRAAVVFNDECTTESVEQFKEMSGGSTNGGVAYTKRLMREQAVSMKIFCHWFFATNDENLLISDTSGSFDRRLFIISHPEIQNLKVPIKKSESLKKYLMKELNSFYELAKQSYLSVKEKYGSLETFVRDYRPISKNLKDAYAEEDKSYAYKELLEDVRENSLYKRAGTDGNGEFWWVLSKDMNPAKDYSEKGLIVNYAKKWGVNPAGLASWIKNTNKLTARVEIKKKVVGGVDTKLWQLRDFKEGEKPQSEPL